MPDVAVTTGRLRLDPMIGAAAYVVLFATGVLAWWRRPEYLTAWRLLFAGTLVSLGVGMSVLLDAGGGLREEPAGLTEEARIQRRVAAVVTFLQQTGLPSTAAERPRPA